MEDIPVTILQRLDEIYQKLALEESLIDLPARELIVNMVQKCSFKMFEETDEYFESERAKEHPHYISPTFGNQAFRVYFNSYSSKVYVDLNRDPMTAIRITLETEAQVLCDIIRSILVVSPD